MVPSRIDGRRTLAEIRAALTVKLDRAEFDNLSAQINGVDVLLLMWSASPGRAGLDSRPHADNHGAVQATGGQP